MKFKSVGILAVGAAIGYALGTGNGRRKMAELKDSGKDFLNRPDVQARTTDLADKAKQRTGSLPPQVQNIANSTIDAAQRATSQGADTEAGESTSESTGTEGATGPDSDDSTPEGGSEQPR